MRVLILPGNKSPENSTWLSQITHQLNIGGAIQSDSIEYDHWSTPDQEIDLTREVNKICHYVEKHQDFVLLAKSIGTILALLANQQHEMHPKAAVFLGVPITQQQIDEFIALFDLVRFPVLCIQQESDKLTSFQDLKAILTPSRKDDVTLCSIPGHDHVYDDFSQMNPLISDWFSRLSIS
jgi:predicted alpha/beta hydrolase family esterase